jgi:sec-independent protein translocase protein TatC
MSIEPLQVVPPRTDRRPEEPRLTIAGHLEELRRRLGVTLAALLVAIGLSMIHVERVIGWLQRPAEGRLLQLAFFSPTEPLVAYVKVAVLAGLILAMPVILSQLWRFVRTGLTRGERSYGLAFVWWGSLQFLAGAMFAYYVLLPVSLKFLLGIGQSYLEPVISIDRYLAFVTTLMFLCGLVFQLPIALFVLAKAGIVTAEWLRQQRPYAILVLVIIAAIVTPTTDPITLLLTAIPMTLLYELSILITRFAIPRRFDTPL